MRIVRPEGAVMTPSKLPDTVKLQERSLLLIHIGPVCTVRKPRTQIISCIYNTLIAAGRSVTYRPFHAYCIAPKYEPASLVARRKAYCSVRVLRQEQNAFKSGGTIYGCVQQVFIALTFFHRHYVYCGGSLTESA
jgi:hypothetical protein